MQIELADMNGVYRGLVTNNVDPEQLCRVQVRIPALWTEGSAEDEGWALVLQPVGSGEPVVPEVGDEVLVGFESGDTTKPVVLGSFRSTT